MKNKKDIKKFNIFSHNQLIFIKKLCGLYKFLEPLTREEHELAEDLEKYIDTFYKYFYEQMNKEV